uniref:Uncharacterized protein n=1 Tax=Panagrolaimus superbus TaxID=310955 RepID=A0A914YJP8_9BILA
MTAGFGHRFTLENYMPPYADEEESRFKIRSETRFVPQEAAVGVYFRAYEYEPGNFKAPMTYVKPSIFAHFSHLGQENCVVDDTHIEIQTCYGTTIQIEVPNATTTQSFRRFLYNDMIDYVISKHTHNAAEHCCVMSRKFVGDILGIEGGWQYFDIRVNDPDSERPPRSNNNYE